MALTPPSTAAVLRPGQDIRVAWILLLLQSGVSYGYALIRELDARGLDADAAATYRALRRLDRHGWVSSSWTGSAVGPRRRSYKLSPTGRQMLRDMANLIASTRDAHDRFLIEYAPG